MDLTAAAKLLSLFRGNRRPSVGARADFPSSLFLDGLMVSMDAWFHVQSA
jgi:hypothetical protein